VEKVFWWKRVFLKSGRGGKGVFGGGLKSRRGGRRCFGEEGCF
jgi:hypothetical protein